MSSNSVPQAVFGPGQLYVTRTDITSPPQTPYNIGFAQEFSYDESATLKEGYGQYSYPVVSAIGTIKATGKMKALAVSGLALAACFFGQSFAAGELRINTETDAIPGTPFQVTVAPPNSGTFDTDLGVTFAATGLPLLKVASAPGASQYSVSAGLYTFNTADTTKSVNISYAYSISASGQKLIRTNPLIGTTPTFQLDYASSLYGVTYYRRFFNCISTKLVMAHKLEDFAMPEVDFSFFANPSQQVYEVTMSTAA